MPLNAEPDHHHLGAISPSRSLSAPTHPSFILFSTEISSSSFLPYYPLPLQPLPAPTCTSSITHAKYTFLKRKCSRHMNRDVDDKKCNR